MKKLILITYTSCTCPCATRSSTSASARICSGECGNAPCIHGNPITERNMFKIATTKRSKC